FNPDVIIGRDRMLYPKNYVREWCAKPRPNKKLPVIANQIIKIRDDVIASDKRFLLVWSPGKPAIYPEGLIGFCNGDINNRRIAQVKTMLAANVEAVDGTEILSRFKPSQDLPLFGRDGLHWNALGASLVVNAMMDRLQAQFGKPIPHVKVAEM